MPATRQQKKLAAERLMQEASDLMKFLGLASLKPRARVQSNLVQVNEANSAAMKIKEVASPEL